MLYTILLVLVAMMTSPAVNINSGKIFLLEVYRKNKPQVESRLYKFWKEWGLHHFHLCNMAL